MNRKLYIFCGIPFSGKTTLAQRAVELLGYAWIDLDEIKFTLFGQAIQDQAIDQPGWDNIYQEMFRQIEKHLKANQTVIHDTGNFTKNERNKVRLIATKLGIDSLTIFVDTSVDVAKRRLLENRKSKARFNVSNADFDQTVAKMEPPTNSEPHLVYKPEYPMDKWILENLK